MKKITILSSFVVVAGMLSAGNPTTISVLNSKPTSVTIKFTPSNYSLEAVTTGYGEANRIDIENGVSLLKAGAPSIPTLTSSFIIPDQGLMQVNVVSSSFYDVENVEIAPSKGNLYRNMNPSDIPYTKGMEYSKNEFYPTTIAALNDPYILRDYRAQTVAVSPFQYNPVTKTLRVYTSVTVSVDQKALTGGVNEFLRTRSVSDAGLDKEIDAIYKSRFINYSNEVGSRVYTPLEESGAMLVICFDDFKTDMQPFVLWKNQKGIATEMVLKSVAGSTSAAIKAYIKTYYEAHPRLKYVLLIGDAPQVPASKTKAGDSDNDYGYILGADSYPEVFIGRFCAATSTQVQTMVARSIGYEKTPTRGGTWYKNGITIASNLGAGEGDNKESDYAHQRLIKKNLMGYTYKNVFENYDGSQGGDDRSGNPTASMISAQLNEGAGVMTYTGHGSETQFVSSGFSSSSASALTNGFKNPFVWSVACVNGNFVKGSCLAEAITRAGTPASPSGALATMMSTINQSWQPPMRGQDAMVEILVESVKGNIKRTFGGISMNGCMDMNDKYGKGGAEMTDTWTCFGDPSVMVFSDTPGDMIVAHPAKISVASVTVTVNCNVKDALVCISKDGVILGTGISDGTSVEITIPAAVEGKVDVVVTAYNKMPYIGTIDVSGTVGINETADLDFINVYPVPTNGALTISGSLTTSGKIKLALYNNLGQEVMLIANESIASGSFNRTFDVSALPAGVYFCKLETGVSIKIQRVIIQ